MDGGHGTRGSPAALGVGDGKVAMFLQRAEYGEDRSVNFNASRHLDNILRDLLQLDFPFQSSCPLLEAWPQHPHPQREMITLHPWRFPYV